jgi:purine-binding chemotaxis protein CheW
MSLEQFTRSTRISGNLNNDNQMKILVFSLDEPRYALPLSTVDRVVRAVEITPLPNAAAIIQGAINLHGKIIPVVNIRERLGLPERDVNCSDHFIIARTHRRNIALVADYVTDIRDISKHEIENAKQDLPFVEYLHGVVKTDENLILIYDLDTFLSLEEERMVAHALSGDL